MKNNHLKPKKWPSRLELQNIPTVFLEAYDSLKECPGYDTIKSDGEAQVMLQLWGMLSTSLLTPVPGLFWPEIVAPDRALFIGQTELNSAFMLNRIV